MNDPMMHTANLNRTILMANGPQIPAASAKEAMWENRIWTITQTMMVGAMLWVGSTLLALSNTVARIEERLAHAVSTQQIRDKLQDERIEHAIRQLEGIRARGTDHR